MSKNEFNWSRKTKDTDHPSTRKLEVTNSYYIKQGSVTTNYASDCGEEVSLMTRQSTAKNSRNSKALKGNKTMRKGAGSVRCVMQKQYSARLQRVQTNVFLTGKEGKYQFSNDMSLKTSFVYIQYTFTKSSSYKSNSMS